MSGEPCVKCAHVFAKHLRIEKYTFSGKFESGLVNISASFAMTFLLKQENNNISGQCLFVLIVFFTIINEISSLVTCF